MSDETAEIIVDFPFVPQNLAVHQFSLPELCNINEILHQYLSIITSFIYSSENKIKVYGYTLLFRKEQTGQLLRIPA